MTICGIAHRLKSGTEQDTKFENAAGGAASTGGDPTMKLTNLLASTAALAFAANAAFAADIFVIGGKPGDLFWSIVKRGAEDAGLVVAAQGGSVTWLGPQNHDNLGVDAAELIRHH